MASIWFLALALLLVTAGLSLTGIGHWLAQPPRVGRVDAIVVVGDCPKRILHGIALYGQGLAPELWHTGSYAQSAARLAIEHGVPAEAIHLLSTTSTWEDGQEISAFAKQRQVDSILVVTSWYHSRRALCVIQQQLVGSGVSIYYDPPALRYGSGNWWQYKDGWTAVCGELVRIGFYWWRYGLAPWRC